MVPSLDAAADKTLALSTIDESLNTGQRDPRRMGTSATGRSCPTRGLARNDWLSSGPEPLLALELTLELELHLSIPRAEPLCCFDRVGLVLVRLT